MDTEPIASPSGGPLNEDHYRELLAATNLIKPIRRAARVAAFNGWTVGFIAALSFPFAFFALDGLAITVGLSAVCFLELWGRRKLLKLDPSATTWLGWNQVGFLALIVAYCLWMLLGEAPDISANPELSRLLGSDGQQLYQALNLTVYGGVIVLSVIFQGGNAIYYFTRRRYLMAYQQQTSPWVREFFKIMSVA
ncbi:hypothetical protein NZK35_21385 [Stieleria sp. ICT_E10.1]|uniref:hypothetical protein n=1 Tax=Stieleria sedimenti TaxID=2976331 RepID=UPI0021800634|nr:hypothetical protein [Stieleria sedimenti]MCS7469212.1 hypothetical protein [Stieleria sedimenti]